MKHYKTRFSFAAAVFLAGASVAFAQTATPTKPMTAAQIAFKHHKLPKSFSTEAAAQAFIAAHVRPGTVVNADEASSWDRLHARYEMKRINHSEAYSLDGACTNWAEEYFSRLRRGEMGHHHHISGPYLLRYAQEAAWREDARRVANGEQVQRVAELALHSKASVDFTGYWQRHKEAA